MFSLVSDICGVVRPESSTSCSLLLSTLFGKVREPATIILKVSDLAYKKLRRTYLDELFPSAFDYLPSKYSWSMSTRDKPRQAVIFCIGTFVVETVLEYSIRRQAFFFCFLTSVEYQYRSTYLDKHVLFAVECLRRTNLDTHIHFCGQQRPKRLTGRSSHHQY
jgi:hypothetical protein